MSLYEMTFLVIILTTCWVQGSATLSSDHQLYKNVGHNNKVFTDNIAFESQTKTELQCARQCSQEDSCVVFTFYNNICRGHNVSMTPCSASMPSSGARSYAEYASVGGGQRVWSEKTGVQRMTDISLGLDRDVYFEGGWMVFQRRQDGSVDFFRDWLSYTTGFGDLHGEFWLGLESLHRITSSGVNYVLRVDMTAWNGTKASALYYGFSVGPAARNYRLEFDCFLGGTAGDSLRTNRRQAFSTRDADHDIDARDCPRIKKGAWWYRSCSKSNLNGQYETNGTTSKRSVHWISFASRFTLKSCQMMIRPANCKWKG